MAKFEERQKAHRLRKKGNSIKAIAAKLGVSKSTVSLWCRDIVLTTKQIEQLKANAISAGHRGRMIGTQRNQQKRLDEIQNYELSGKKEIGKMTKRDLIILASALFWAEGAKTGSRFMFINSDPNMILCIYRYLMTVEKISPDRLFLTVQINRIHEPRIQKVIKFWSELLDLPRQQIGKPYYIDVVPRKQYQNYESYYGIARLAVRGGSSLQYKLLGYINAFR